MKDTTRRNLLSSAAAPSAAESQPAKQQAAPAPLIRLPPPLTDLLTQIMIAAENQLHLLAISMVVALPDICVSLASDDGRSNGERYKKWCTDNLPAAEFGFVTGDDLWSMRCGVLHNGRFGDLKHNVARVIFTLPDIMSFTNSKVGDAYLYSVVEFCRNMSNAVTDWYEAHKGEKNVTENLARMMQYHPDGVSPYIKGTRVLA